MLKEEEGLRHPAGAGQAPLGTLTAVSDSVGTYAGYVQNPAVDVPRKAHAKLDVGAAPWAVTEIHGHQRTWAEGPLCGQRPAGGRQIAEDITPICGEQQIPTACALGV